MKRMLVMLSFLVVGSLVMSSFAGAQTREIKVCVPDYSVGVMPFFIAKITLVIDDKVVCDKGKILV